MHNATLIAVFFSALCSIARGEPSGEQHWDFAAPKKEKCSAGNMLEMNQCLANEYAESDHRLNVVYTHLVNALNEPRPLKRAQAAWLRFRDLQCKFQVPPTWSGSGVPYSRNACLIDHTERRIRDLEGVLPCNGCVDFKDNYYGDDPQTRYELPPR